MGLPPFPVSLAFVVLALFRMVSSEVQQGAVLENFERGLRTTGPGMNRCPPVDVCGSLFSFCPKVFQRFSMVLANCSDPTQCGSGVCVSNVKRYREKGYVCESEQICDCKGRFLYTAGVLHDLPTGPGDRRIAELVDELDGNVTDSFLVVENIFDPVQSPILKDHIDKVLKKSIAKGHTVKKGVPIDKDLLINVDPAELKGMIGIQSIVRMYRAFKKLDPAFPVSRFLLRRTEFGEEVHMEWHKDGSNVVMHVFLDESDVKGGNYLFIGKDGMTEVETPTGSGLVHGHNVVHAIQSFVGQRYILLLVGDHIDAHDVVLDMMAKEVVAEDL